MKRLILYLTVLFLCISCGTAKKVQDTSRQVQTDSTSVSKDVEKHVDKVIDTTQTDKGKITITEIEFFPPVDTPKSQNDTTAPPGAETSGKPSVSVDMDNFGNVQGSVKSIKQTVIEKDTEKKGESKESEAQKESNDEAVVQKNDFEEQKFREPTKDPLRWRYIFYTSLIGVAVALFLYIKRKPILGWLRKILSPLRRLFAK